jgi:hypothetical protein
MGRPGTHLLDQVHFSFHVGITDVAKPPSTYANFLIHDVAVYTFEQKVEYEQVDLDKFVPVMLTHQVVIL